MIIKGGARAKPNELSTHLLRADTNENIRLFDLSGVAARDLRGALAEMNAVAGGSRATKPLYHVSVSPGLATILSDEQWRKTISTLEKALGLEGHQRAVVLHTKKDRQHAHIVWNRVDAETLKAAHHGHNYRIHEIVARQLEREFGLDHVQGVHVDREGPRPERRADSRESQQEGRTGWSRDRAARDITDAWARSENGQGFIAALEEAGYRLVRGDRKDVVILDPNGGVHGVARRITGVRAADVRAKLSDLVISDLPRLSDVRRDDHELQPQPSRPAARAPNAKPRRRPDQPPSQDRYRALKERQPPHGEEPHSSPVSRDTARPATPNAPALHRDAPQPPLRSTHYDGQPRRHETDLKALRARHDEAGANEAALLTKLHQQQLATLDAYHAQRLVDVVADVDRSIIAHNGLVARLGSVTSRQSYYRRLAYLVAKREGIWRREAERQDRVRAELRVAQDRERQTATEKRLAKNRHEEDRLNRRHGDELQHREAGKGPERDGPR